MIDGIIAQLLEEKWKKFAKTRSVTKPYYLLVVGLMAILAYYRPILIGVHRHISFVMDLQM